MKSTDRPLGARMASLLAPLRHRGVVLPIIASLVAAGGRGLGILTKNLPLYLLGPIKLPHTRDVTILYTLLLAGSIVGPLLAGRVSDRTGAASVAADQLWAGDGLYAAGADSLRRGRAADYHGKSLSRGWGWSSTARVRCSRRIW